MTMKRKLLLTMVLLVAVPMLVSVMAGNWFAKGNSSQLLTGQAEKKLISMREFRKRGVEEFFVDIRRQITAMAQADAVVEATTRFNNSYFDFTLEAGISGKMDKLRDGLNQYYQNQFSAAYKTANPDSTLATQPLFDSLSENSMALQALYISENKFPLGEKEKLKIGRRSFKLHHFSSALPQSVFVCAAIQRLQRHLHRPPRNRRDNLLCF